MRTMLTNLLMDESGQGMAEYGLILALVAVVVAASLTVLQGGLSSLFSNVGAKVTPSTTP